MPTIDYRNKNGDRVSGTTTIIGSNLGWSKTPLCIWNYNRGHDDGLSGRPQDYKGTMQRAADAGTICHAMIEANLKKEEYHIPEEVEEGIKLKAIQAFVSFTVWKGQNHLEVVALEPHLVSEIWQYGATPDCIARINDRLCLFDWKSSNSIHEEYALQIAAYRAAWEENHPDMLLEGGFHLLRIDKDTAGFDHIWRQELPDAWESFLSCLNLHKRHKTVKGLIG